MRSGSGTVGATRDPRIDDTTLARAAALLRSLAHPLRLRLIEALEQGEKTVSELQEYTNASQPVVSQQLATLRGHGIVEARCQGQFHFYHLAYPQATTILDCIRRDRPGD